MASPQEKCSCEIKVEQNCSTSSEQKDLTKQQFHHEKCSKGKVVGESDSVTGTMPLVTADLQFEIMSDIGLDSYWDGRVSSEVGGDEFDGMLGMSMWDLPMESLEGEEFLENWDPSHSEFMGPIQLDFLTPQPAVPYENISTQHSLTETTTVEAIDETTVKKQLPSYVEESSSATLHSRNEFTGVHQAQSSVSMLESSGSNSTGENLPIKSSTKVPVRSRSERVRALGKNPWRLISLATNPPSQSTSNFTKSEKRRKTSAQPSVATQASNMRPNCEAAAIRECSHCGITRTPQWREGPLGRKTLCNACGVRYRSGRLLPEYRPAASPTFVPSLHSNSHKKVIEMRRKANGI